MNNKRNKIPKAQQNNIYPVRSNSLRPATQDLKKPGTVIVEKSDIEKLIKGQDQLIQGQKDLASIISTLTESINNLTQKISDLVEKNNGSGKSSKKGALNQSFLSNYSKNSSGTAYYKRRDLDKKNDKKEESSIQNKAKPENKTIQVVKNYDNYNKVKKNK